MEDYRTFSLSEAEKALFGLIEKVTLRSNQVTQADIDQVKAAGWSEEAIYDTVTVCALFQFYNAWIDATGVEDMPAEAYVQSGFRLATQGYAGEDVPNTSGSTEGNTILSII
ncbi:MAG TPA: peroxidase [Acidobacteriota bacterium]|nr:peroxidase [Acidobacteriota bacterium]